MLLTKACYDNLCKQVCKRCIRFVKFLMLFVISNEVYIVGLIRRLGNYSCGDCNYGLTKANASVHGASSGSDKGQS